MSFGVWDLRKKALELKSGFFQRLSTRIARKVYNYSQNLLGFYVPLGVKFKGEPYFPHGVGGVYISSHSRIGSDAVIFQQVTIGSNTLIDSPGLGSPIVGDRCYIGAGAKVIGRLVIGDDVRIGANAVVTKDVPSGVTVVGYNRIILNAVPGCNRHYRESKGRWESVTGSGVVDVSSEEEMKLNSAFKNDA